MGLTDFIKKQFIDVIEADKMPSNSLAWKYPMADNEIQNGASLTVREGQLAIFINEGKVADVFCPGMYTLSTNTMPVLTYLKNWDKFFASPFKADVIFVSTLTQTNRKWGTSQPVTIRDADFGVIRLRAFGSTNYRIDNVQNVIASVLGASSELSVTAVDTLVRDCLLSAFGPALAKSNSAFLDMAANQQLMADMLCTAVNEVLGQYGLVIENLFIESLNLPDNLTAALDKRSEIAMVGNLGALSQYQAANAIEVAAANEGGGLAALGAQMVLGGVVGSAIGAGLNGAAPTNSQAAASVATKSPEDEFSEKVASYLTMKEKGLINEDEFVALKATALKKLMA